MVQRDLGRGSWTSVDRDHDVNIKLITTAASYSGNKFTLAGIVRRYLD